jgi:hypothetical protein
MPAVRKRRAMRKGGFFLFSGEFPADRIESSSGLLRIRQLRAPSGRSGVK